MGKLRVEEDYCPHCGSGDTTETAGPRFAGDYILVECWCYECEKPFTKVYLVTYVDAEPREENE